MWEYNNTSELYHYGVPGMRWGVRRFQKENGSPTDRGHKRYSDDTSHKGPKKEKSKHRLRLESEYRQNGLTKEQAQDAAAKRIRTEKILAASAAMTVTAAAAYYAHNKHKAKIDQVIKAGESLQRIEMQDTGGKLHDVFYASKGNHDNKRYAGMLGMTRQKQAGKAYIMKLEATKDVKVASRDKAAKAFVDLYKNDKSFKNAMKEDGIAVLNESDKGLKKLYEAFNRNLVYAKEQPGGSGNMFYNKLKSMGYGAIQDINDMKYSGYNAKNPLIVFDNSKNSIMVKSMKEMSGNLFKSGMKEQGKAIAETLLSQSLPVAAIGLTAKTVTTYNSSPTKNKKRKGANNVGV